MEVKDVTKTSAKVKWQKPEDDGGTPIREYEIEKMDMATGKWVRVGRVPGDREKPEFEVTGLTPGAEYKFRVTAVNDEGDSEPLVTERGTIAKNPFGNILLCSFIFLEYLTILLHCVKKHNFSNL